jgi:hypothetical protein
VEQQPPPKKHGGIGMGGLALGAGAGLLGGFLLGEEIESLEDRDRFGGGGFGGGGGETIINNYGNDDGNDYGNDNFDNGGGW